MKLFDVKAGGVPLDASFDNHQLFCERCREYDATRPATAANLCLEGSVLLKRDAPKPPPKQRAPKNEYIVSKDEVKRRMRYVQ